ncbi:MAG: ABC transporter ATP-binding protein [Thermoplasmata archaeon]|nr:ABC transporter ATP-binding protein [Thermoplasmata archaeon]
MVLRVDHLGYSYSPGQFAIRELEFEVGRGEVFGLLGRNGAGKTTTVRVLTTLLAPTEGTAYLFGKELGKCGRAERARLGVVLQAESLDFVSVERNLTLYAFLWGVPREVAKSRAEEMLALFELEAVRQRKPWGLSGGERRRFQVARELMHEMELLFLDEPTVGLDALTRKRILDYLARRARQGLSIVFTTHILQEADQLCHRIGVLQNGRLRAHGPPAEIKRKYRGARTVEAEFERELVGGESAELLELLTREGEGFSPVAVDPNAFVFQAQNAEDLVASISRWAHGRGLTLERISVREATLEEAFVHLVSEEAVSEPPARTELA